MQPECERSTMTTMWKPSPTRVPQLPVPEDRDDDQQVPQHVHHRGEDQDTGQDGYDPGGAGAALGGQCALQLPQLRLRLVPDEAQRVRHPWPRATGHQPRVPTRTLCPADAAVPGASSGRNHGAHLDEFLSARRKQRRGVELTCDLHQVPLVSLFICVNKSSIRVPKQERRKADLLHLPPPAPLFLPFLEFGWMEELI